MKRLIARELREVQQILHRRVEKEKLKQENSLTHVQMRILIFVSCCDADVFQRDIERELKVRRSTASQMLRTLERDGYITRESIAHDARLKVIRLSEKSKAILDTLNQNMNRMEATLKQNISKDELDVFFSVIDRIKENLR